MCYLCTQCDSYVHPHWCPNCQSAEYIRLDIDPDHFGTADEAEEDLCIY